MKKITLDGNEACARTSYLFTEVAGIYPITPSSPMSEFIDNESNKGTLNLFNDRVKVVEMQSEAGAAGFVHGSLTSGLLTSTYTSSQGLLLMIPNMYKIAGEMLPAVFHVAARSLATHALSIMGDHQDVYATRQTGFAILASSSVQDAALLSAVAHLSAIETSIPFLHFFDGFRTSHEIDKIDILESKDYAKLINKNALKDFRNRGLNPNRPVTKGTAQNDDIYFQVTEARNLAYEKVADIVEEYMNKINELAGTNYKPFNYYGNKKAEKVIVAMGSVNETIKETIDYLNDKNYNVGLIEVHLYRPFSVKHLLNVLPKEVKKIAVLDRTKEPGSIGEPLYLDIVAALNGKNISIYGGRYGLSSKNTNPACIKAVYDFLDKPFNNFTVGINDDVTNRSLKIDENFKISSANEMLIYGYGSDGMVSASKSIIKTVGENTNNYVQGYFEYDSKKSGGVTISHLRFDENKIRSTYYVENPNLVVCTKESYLDRFDILDKIKENGTFILNTEKNEEEIKQKLNDNIKYIIKKKHLNFYIINAYSLASKVGIKGKISTIMESVILKLSNVMDYEKAIIYMKNEIEKKFSKKGEEVITANKKAIDESLKILQKVELNDEDLLLEQADNFKCIEEAILDRKGEMLPVSSFMDYKDGTAKAGFTDKNAISAVVPKWNKEACLECNQCSFVCPHGVIRPYLLSEEEYEAAPNYIKERCKKPLLKSLQDYYFVIGIAIDNCTGCTLCMKTCPNRGKALTAWKIDDARKNKEAEIFNYLDKKIKNKSLFDIYSVKGSQFERPRLAFEGACAGCGEPAYIRILTQLFGKELIIANATGCSSIYGASSPCTPYEVPWANSLFEDNAEFALGMVTANKQMKARIRKIMEENKNNPLCKKYLENENDYKVTEEVYENIDYSAIPELKKVKEYIKKRSIWAVGGDGWAYDIGYGGIDHVLSTNENINILVLDTQVYSNTGGQASKATPIGALAQFAGFGKKNYKKDLARMALAYPHVYVATVCLGANPNQLVKVLKEANEYEGPSIVIAYAPCISHGIKGGMENSIDIEKEAVACGYYPLFHYKPGEDFVLDSKNVNFDDYPVFIERQTRFNALKKVNPSEADKLLEYNILEAKKRFYYYENLAKK